MYCLFVSNPLHCYFLFIIRHLPLHCWRNMANAYLPFTTLQTMRSMQIHTFNVGMLSTNCYVVNCVQTREAIIIDPGLDVPSEAEQIVRYVDKSKLKVKFIVNTHGHPDHIRGDRTLKEKYSVPICIHAYDAHCLHALGGNISPVNILLEDEGLIKFGQETLKVMHTPGHTPGSICLLARGDDETHLFSGDTLFAGSVGRADFPGGDAHALRESIGRLAGLPGETRVHTGHGPDTTIERESRVNFFWPRR